MEWIVRLSGDSDILEDLSSACNSKDLFIERVMDYYVMKSSSFGQMARAREVLKKAEEFLVLINGAATLILGLRHPLKAEGVTKVDEEGKRHIFLVAKGGSLSLSGGRVKMPITTADGKTYEVNEAAPIPDWVMLAERDDTVAKVLRKISEGNLDLNKLNIIFEDIQGDVGSGIHEKGRVSKRQVDRFTCSVQPERHGKSGLKKRKWRPHKIPMDLHEARSFVWVVVSNWINSKLYEESST